jgi:hypothetical protein
VLGAGERLFGAGGSPVYLEGAGSDAAGAAVLTRYIRARE